MPDDIFLSYAHIDNQPYNDPKGWVDNFFARLKVRLEQMLGRETEIWWDKRMQGNDYFAGEIGDRITGSRFLVSVVTPRYVQSKWCRGEVREFCRRAEANGGLRRNNHSRLFKVLKTPVEREEEPEPLHGANGYFFYEFDDKNVPREFRQELAPNKDQRYWDRLDDLAWHIKKTIDNWGGGGPPGGNGGGGAPGDGGPPADWLPPNESPASNVYLAETSSDIAGERDRVWRELTQRQYGVRPDKELPRRFGDLREYVREQLRGCSLSVHMIGAGYGFVPDGDALSAAALQEKLAAERASEDSSFSRLVWMPPGLDSEDRRQREFISRLKSGLGSGAELLETGVEGLKTRILDKLKPREAMEERPDRTRVYLIHDERDTDAVGPIARYLRDHFDVVTSADAVMSEQAALHHRQSLLNSDATLIYYGEADPEWLSTKVFDLQKARGWGQGGRLGAAVLYVGAPRTQEKERLVSDEDDSVIVNFGAFKPDVVQSFLKAVTADEGRRK